MTTRRKDNKGRVLRQGETQRKNVNYDYRWLDKTGRRHSFYAPTLVELRKKQKEILKDELEGIKTSSSRMTVNDIYGIWKNVKRGIKDNTFQNYKYMYETFMQDDIGKYPIKDLKPTDIRMYYNKLIEKRNLKITTLDSIHTVLYQVLEIAVEEERIRNNPARNALTELKRTHNVDEEKRKVLSIEEQVAFEDYLGKTKISTRWEPIFTIMLNTGLRVGEVTGVTWDDVDFENNTISVNRTLTYYVHEDGFSRLAVNPPKTAKSKRTIPMLDVVRASFRKEKQIQKDLNIKQIKIVDGISNFVFVNRVGNPINQAPLNKTLRRMVRQYNETQLQKPNTKEKLFLPRISCHSLRHTFATRQVEANVNSKVLQEIMGHADIKTTMNIYVEVTNELKEREFEKYEKYIESMNELK